jgi:ABC-type transport system involved in cytochrome c biogenesis permease subunit
VSNDDLRAPPEENQVRAMGVAALGALLAAFVAALVLAFLDTDFGQEIASDLDGPGRFLVAAPVVAMCAVVFTACMLSLVLPERREQLMNLAVITAWLIAAWVVMATVILAGLAYAVDHLEN